MTTTTHKTLRGPRGGMILCREAHAKAIDKSVFPGIQGGPLMHIIAAKAVAFGEAMSEDFRADQRATVDNARTLAAALADAGASIVSGGTDNHLMLVDVRPLGVNGKEADAALGEVQITVNKNTIPYRPREADDRLRHPRRHAGHHLAGHAGGRDARDRAADRGRDRGPRGRHRAGRHSASASPPSPIGSRSPACRPRAPGPTSPPDQARPPARSSARLTQRDRWLGRPVAVSPLTGAPGCRTRQRPSSAALTSS